MAAAEVEDTLTMRLLTVTVAEVVATVVVAAAAGVEVIS